MTDVAAIKKIIGEHNANLARWYAQGAIDRVAQVFAEDCWQMPPNNMPLVGREALREGWGELVQWGRWNFSFAVQDVAVGGNIAVERGKYELEFTAGPGAPENMPSRVDRGNYVVLWRLESDGEWRIAWDAPVSELPIPGSP